MYNSALKRMVVRAAPDLAKWHIRNRILRTPLSTHYPYEPEMKLIRSIVPDHMPFFDIGANQGRYSILVEDIVGPENVYCFEPIPSLALSLQEILHKSKIYRYAMSDKEATESIRIPLIEGTLYETRATLERDIVEVGATGFITVETLTTTIDAFINKNHLNLLGFIKIDVEGHEVAVIRGGIKTLHNYQPLLLVEIEQRHHQNPISEIFSWIESIGYTGYYLDASELVMQSIHRFSVRQHQNIKNIKAIGYINNFIFIPKMKVAETLEKISKTLIHCKRSNSVDS